MPSDLRAAADALNEAGDENERAMIQRKSQLEALAHFRRVAGKLLTAAEDLAIKALESAIAGALK